MLIIRAQHDWHNVQLQPEPRAESRAHVLERGRQTSANELREVFVLIFLNLFNDVVRNQIGTHAHGIVENNVLDGEIDEVDRVMDGECDDSGVIISEHGRDTQEEGLFDAKTVSEDPEEEVHPGKHRGAHRNADKEPDKKVYHECSTVVANWTEFF